MLQNPNSKIPCTLIYTVLPIVLAAIYLNFYDSQFFWFIFSSRALLSSIHSLTFRQLSFSGIVVVRMRTPYPPVSFDERFLPIVPVLIFCFCGALWAFLVNSMSELMKSVYLRLAISLRAVISNFPEMVASMRISFFWLFSTAMNLQIFSRCLNSLLRIALKKELTSIEFFLLMTSWMALMERSYLMYLSSQCQNGLSGDLPGLAALLVGVVMSWSMRCMYLWVFSSMATMYYQLTATTIRWSKLISIVIGYSIIQTTFAATVRSFSLSSYKKDSIYWTAQSLRSSSRRVSLMIFLIWLRDSLYSMICSRFICLRQRRASWMGRQFKSVANSSTFRNSPSIVAQSKMLPLSSASSDQGNQRLIGQSCNSRITQSSAGFAAKNYYQSHGILLTILWMLTVVSE